MTNGKHFEEKPWRRESRSITNVSLPSLHSTFPGTPHITTPGTMRKVPTSFQTCDAHSAARQLRGILDSFKDGTERRDIVPKR